MNQLQKKIRSDRKKMAMTQEEFAAYVGISMISVVRIEQGLMVSSNLAKKLAYHYKVNPITIIEWNNSFGKVNFLDNVNKKEYN